MKKIIACSLLGLGLSGAANAATIGPFSDWTSDSVGGTSPNWVNQEGRDTVRQTKNSNPSVYYQAGSNAQGSTFSGTFGVDGHNDDDFIGFVLGYQPNELKNTFADFWLIDWKAADQGKAGVGLTLSHVTHYNVANQYWEHNEGVHEVQSGFNFGSTGWEPKTEYSYDLTFTSDLIEMYLDGNLELSLTPAAVGLTTFADGAFGFYNNSQKQAYYSLDGVANISEVPLPAAAWLFAPVVAGVFGLKSRNKRKAKVA